jgi:hypothetical protein
MATASSLKYKCWQCLCRANVSWLHDHTAGTPLSQSFDYDDFYLRDDTTVPLSSE